MVSWEMKSLLMHPIAILEKTAGYVARNGIVFEGELFLSYYGVPQS